jgi:hypothetical protein
MGNGRDIGAQVVQLLPDRQLMVTGRQRFAAIGGHIPHQQHVGRPCSEIEVISSILCQHRRGERAETFAVFDLHVQLFLHLRIPGIAQYAPVAEGAGAEFHAPLEPSHCFTLVEKLRRFGR